MRLWMRGAVWMGAWYTQGGARAVEVKRGLQPRALSSEELSPHVPSSRGQGEIKILDKKPTHQPAAEVDGSRTVFFLSQVFPRDSSHLQYDSSPPLPLSSPGQMSALRKLSAVHKSLRVAKAAK